MVPYIAKTAAFRQSDQIRRTPAGAIDTDYYRRRGETLRSEAFLLVLRKLYRKIRLSFATFRQIGEIGTVLEIDDSAKL